ncbi:MAG TPA: GAF domain-containing protein [Burkholderiales bacterium]|nr:GAF domain-containing protein [Burkholderiales bacterium]
MTSKNKALRKSLGEALERENATGEILSLISRGPNDTQPVFEAIVKSCASLFGSANSTLLLIKDGQAELAATTLRGPGREFVVPIDDDSFPAARAVLKREIVHLPDAFKANWARRRFREFARQHGIRAFIVAPLLREDKAIGIINVTRPTPGPFSEQELALLQAFADEAVIAIENARLFNETKEALEQQTATADVLKLISRTTFELQPVLDTLVRSAAELCEAQHALYYRIDPDGLRPEAWHNVRDEYIAFRRADPIPLASNFNMARAALMRQPVHIHDLLAEPGYGSEQAVRLGEMRTVLGVPVLREGEPIGVIGIFRLEVRPFAQKQIELVKTFADQAVIAIENVRLFKELQARNAEVSEALEQQTATTEILKVISQSPTDTQPVFDAIAERTARLCEANDVMIRRIDGDVMHVVAHVGPVPVPENIRAAKITRGTIGGRAILERRMVQVEDVSKPEVAEEYPDALFRRYGGNYRTFLAAPLLRGDTAIGLIVIRRQEMRPFSEKQIAILQTFADQAVIAIENVRLFKELQARNAEVTEALEQQTTTAEILKVISQSPTDTQPVFDAIVKSGVHLFGGMNMTLRLVKGDESVTVASTLPVAADAYVVSINEEGSTASRAIRRREVVQVPDIPASDWLSEHAKRRAQARGYRAALTAPLLREDVAIGVVNLIRAAPGEFTDKQIALLKTFAAQAVIAIENVRLFKELQARNAEITEALEQQTATAEILKVISNSPTDTQPVFEAIIDNALRLCDAPVGGLGLYDGERILRVAQRGDRAELTKWLAENQDLSAFPASSSGVRGRLSAELRPIHILDRREIRAYRNGHPLAVAQVQLNGLLTSLAIPMLKEGRLIGLISVNRREVRAFTEKQIALLQTFADQAVIAIENVRLFKEIQNKNRELEIASRHKSEFLASMSHELRTPLNAILGFNEMIIHGLYGEVPPDMKVPLDDIQSSGKHLLRLINNVLDLAKIEAGRMELALADYSIQDTAESVRSALRPLAAEKKIEFIISVPEDIPLVHGDSGRITQCLVNLAGNSLKFTKAGKVEISVSHHDSLLTCCVSDTGVGIPPDKIGGLFTEFKQTDATIASEYGGTGLGLSITKKFIEMHGGRIWVESEVGQGSRFTFEIPLRAVAKATEEAHA